MSQAMSSGHFDAFTRGRIVGLAEAGMKAPQIARLVKKTNNKHPKPDAVVKTVRKSKLIKGWDGRRAVGSGRRGSLSGAVKKKIVKLAFKHRGSNVVTVKFIKKMLPSTRKVCDNTVSTALHEAGLAWLRRRLKRFVPRKYIPVRLSFARWLLRLPVEQTRNKHTNASVQLKRRAYCLGFHVRRQKDGRF